MTALPSIFVSHGAPTLALAPAATGAALERAADAMARPRGVVVASAHWETHGAHARDATPERYAAELDAWLDARLVGGDREALLDYRARAPHAVRNHPTEEHLLPLFVSLGAVGEGARARRLHAAIEYGVLSTAAWAFDSAPTTR
jgi:4,5-DOPA dioxygenase extradiol